MILLILTWYLLKIFFLDRVLGVSRQVININKNNLFNDQIYTSEKDEITDMVSSINRMMSLISHSKKELEYMAHHDSLTKLPNRIYFYNMLEVAIQECEANNTRMALMFLDMNKFKNINDTYGHDVGDKVLISISRRLTNVVKSTDLVARQAGDEFILFISNIVDEAMVVEIANRIFFETSKPFQIDKAYILATFSIGISMYPDDGKDIEVLMKKADTAMYSAKKQTGNAFCFYKDIPQDESAEANHSK